MNCAAVSAWSDSRKYFPFFLKSAERNGLTIHNCDQSSWGGLDWRTIEWWRKIVAQHRFVVEHPEYTHCMFTDSYDVVFAAGWTEILAKYQSYESPIVFGTESYCWPTQAQAALYPETPHRSKYLNAGFYLGERAALLDFLGDAAARAQRKEQCDSGIFVDMFLSGQYPIKLDNCCSLMFCTNNGSLAFIEERDGRPICKDSGAAPCVFHGNGNSPLEPIIQMLKL